MLSRFRQYVFVVFAAFAAIGGYSPPARAAGANPAQTWTATGGDLGFIWNEDLLRDIGMALEQRSGLGAADGKGFVAVQLREQGGLRFGVQDGNFSQFMAGRLGLRGGFRLATPDGGLSLVDASLQPRAGDGLVLDLVDAEGKTWFYLDKLMYALSPDGRQLRVRTMDLRIHPDLAARLGKPQVAGWAVAQMRMNLDVLAQDGAYIVTGGGGAPVWPGQAVSGVSGATHQADVFMLSFNAQYSRCTRALNCSGSCACDGPAGATDGHVVFTPNSTLRNNVNNGTPQPTVTGDPLGTSTALYAADVAWYEMFSGTFAPYDNDQHPNLIWNLYHIDTQGRIEQIGRSGVKHAFLTTNVSCSSSPGSGGSDPNILGRSCSDTYGTGNNDSNEDLGPRSEIVPAQALWGRCGSIFDPDCDDSWNPGGNNNFSQRLITRESQLAAAGGSFYFESWYLVRDDINIYNTMATRPVSFSYAGSGPWVITNGNPTQLGPAINRWVDPAGSDPSQRNVEISSGEGHSRVAVKVSSVGGGHWRYDYAVMNLDFARAATQGTPGHADDSNPAQRFRVIHNFGFDRFSVPLPAGATASAIEFGDGDLDAANDWSASAAGGQLTWTAPSNPSPPAGVPAVLNALNWGTLFRFSFTADRSPATADISLHVAQAGTPQAYSANLLAPAAVDAIFTDGFNP